MIDRRTVFEIHRLFHEGYGIRKIARTLKAQPGQCETIPG